ncbi:MAG: MATE family efflux transporter [Spirochaetales bacterium]|nr:MATE family efflux transporter [Spirochaetales bacterium]
MDKRQFRHDLFSIAIPVTLQCLLQSSFSIADQIMVGQLGSVSIAAIGFAGKFTGLCSTVVNAVVTAASIMLSQYVGKKDKEGEYRAFRLSLVSSLVVAVFFFVLSSLIPSFIMGLYSSDPEAVQVASSYLRIVSFTFVPMAITLMASASLRCRDRAKLPMYATFFSVVLNTLLNYVFIFILHKGAEGAAWATVISQFTAFIIVMALGFRTLPVKTGEKGSGDYGKAFVKILLPIMVCEFMWSLGENVYGGVYGHIGTDAAAAMVLSYPIQNIMIGALTGVSQAAGIMVGKLLGNKEYDSAKWASKKLMVYGLVGSAFISLLIIVSRPLYLSIYNVEESVRNIGSLILLVYAFIAPVKVSNMILAGGILRSGGRTDLTGAIDILGTWVFGVPLALISSSLLHLPIHLVYLILSMEEVVRLFTGFVVFKKGKWMKSL